VIGEIALGHLRSRDRVLVELRKLRTAEVASDPELLRFIERHKLFGRGVGYIDVHLVASAILTDNCALWTRDKRLRGIAEQIGAVAKGLN
jgi:predicted nucleic acid-binding protein